MPESSRDLGTGTSTFAEASLSAALLRSNKRARVFPAGGEGLEDGVDLGGWSSRFPGACFYVAVNGMATALFRDGALLADGMVASLIPVQPIVFGVKTADGLGFVRSF